jgi:hypothetical protein
LANQYDGQAGEARLKGSDRPCGLEPALDDVLFDDHEGEGDALLTDHGSVESHGKISCKQRWNR